MPLRPFVGSDLQRAAQREGPYEAFSLVQTSRWVLSDFVCKELARERRGSTGKYNVEAKRICLSF